MEGMNVPAELIVSIPETQFYSVTAVSKALLFQGPFDLVQIHDRFALKFGEFQILITPNLRVAKDEFDHFIIITSTYYFGIVLGPSASRKVIKVLQQVFTDHASFTMHYSNKNVRKAIDLIEKGGAKAKVGIAKTAVYLSEKMKIGTEFFRKRVKPLAEPTTVSEKHQKRLRQLKQASNAMVFVSRALFSGASAVTGKLAEGIATQVENSEKMKQYEQSAAFRHARAVGISALSTGAQVSDSIDQAVAELAKEGSASTVAMVDHRYGPQAAAFTRDGLIVAGNIGGIYRDFGALGKKALVKRTAKDTAGHFARSHK